MSEKKDIKLTNWQVPRDPKMAYYDHLNTAPPIDMKKYENVGEVVHNDSVDAVINKMIADKEAKLGVKIDQVAAEKPLNMNGVNDNRDRKKWNVGDPIDFDYKKQDE